LGCNGLIKVGAGVPPPQIPIGGKTPHWAGLWRPPPPSETEVNGNKLQELHKVRQH